MSQDTAPSCPLGFGGPLLNPRNMMPEISQNRSADQKVELSTERVQSSIPITAAPSAIPSEPSSHASLEASPTSSCWMYPSSQQFYNALKRRDKEPEAEAMDSVVYVHNFVNEATWRKIKKWEEAAGCKEPSLRRFVGRSEEPSPLGRIRGLGLGQPFDRHDWYVDRCGKETVRYVIDYFDAPSEDGLDVVVHARPAIDSFGGLRERLWGLFR